MKRIDKEFRIALNEIGPIEPIWSEADQMFYFEHDNYPAVIYGAKTTEETVKGYKRVLREWIEDRLAGNVAPGVERITSGRGGYRPGAGRPKKEPTEAVRVQKNILDVVNWLREDPKRADRVRKLMKA
ncbi:MAG: hypothetical protein C4530_24170 [Desulfobacteraceae bacterium]|nr:MAG: hypothetical protein C4530_24170 [Desulfobacteraceae bacterium]